MNYLLDTCIISELIAKEPNSQVVVWIDQIDDERLFLSVITVGEIARGIKRLPQSQRKQTLLEWLHNDLLFRFQGKILALTVDIMLRWGELTATGRTLPAIDSLLAATALTGDLVLVTRNVKDFEETGVQIINPWEL